MSDELTLGETINPRLTGRTDILSGFGGNPAIGTYPVNPVTLADLRTQWQSIGTAIRQHSDQFDLHVVTALCRNAYEACERSGIESYLVFVEPDLHYWDPNQRDLVQQVDEFNEIRKAYEQRGKRAPSLGLVNADLGTFWDCVLAMIHTTELAAIQTPIDQAKRPLLPSALGARQETVPNSLWLPELRIAQENVSGTEQFRIRLEPFGKGGRLTVYLDAGGDVSSADWSQDLVHAFVTYGQQALRFSEIIIEEGVVRIVLTVDTLADFHQLREIISDPGYGAKLVVRWLAERCVPTNQMELALLPQDATERQDLAAALAAQVKDLREREASPEIDSRHDTDIRLLHLERQLRLLENPVPMCVTWSFLFDHVAKPERFSFDRSLYPYIFESGK